MPDHNDHDGPDDSTKEVEVDLTDDEVAAKSRQLAGQLEAYERRKTEAKEVARQYKQAIDKDHATYMDLARCVSSRKERRRVPVQERPNVRLFCVDTIREDTGESIGSRPMTNDELSRYRQPSLFEAAPDQDGDQRTETGTLPLHEPVETISGPQERVPCPGPTGQGCDGDACSRCAGMRFVPAGSVEPAGSGADLDPGEDGPESEYEDDPSTAIDARELPGGFQ